MSKPIAILSIPDPLALSPIEIAFAAIDDAPVPIAIVSSAFTTLFFPIPIPLTPELFVLAFSPIQIEFIAADRLL